MPAAASNLKRLRGKLRGNPKARVREPEFMAVITGLSHYAREVGEGIYSIPIRALAPRGHAEQGAEPLASGHPQRL